MGPTQSPKPFSLLFFSILFFAIFGSSSSGNTNLVYKGCANQKFQDPTGIYSKSLETLFSTLISQSTSNKFFKTTAGDGQSAIVGLFQCRGNLSNGDCNNCGGVSKIGWLFRLSKRKFTRVHPSIDWLLFFIVDRWPPSQEHKKPHVNVTIGYVGHGKTSITAAITKDTRLAP